MKIFNAEKIKNWDKYTIQNEGIESINLMERASEAFTDWFTRKFVNKTTPIFVFCGNGNNGGDGLAISRLLYQKSYNIHIIVLAISDKRSADNQANLNAIEKFGDLKTTTLFNRADLPAIPDSSIIIDAIFGTGLNKELHGFTKELVETLNALNAVRIAVDIPSGLLADKASRGTVFNAHYTFSFEQPKLAFMFPENDKYVGKWIAESINLSKAYYSNEATDHHLLTDNKISSYYKKRNKFEHKGNFGHALLIMGSKGKIGAAFLSAYSSLRSGCGLTTIYTPNCGYEILQTSIPEAMVVTDKNEFHISDVPNIDIYDAIGVGCGLGVKSETQKAFSDLLQKSENPLVLDADALNIIAENPDLIMSIPKHSILTPHPKEFERLFGKSSDNFERNDLQRNKAISLQCFILLKGAHSCIATPMGLCYYNSTGNPGMATAGSGDVLTGIITGLLAQGYSSKAALCLGVYLHGLAGDLASNDLGEESIMARDIIEYLPKAYLQLHQYST